VGVVVVEAPTWPLVPPDEAKAHVKIDADVTDYDGEIGGMLLAASESVDGPPGDYGIAVGLQTLLATFEGFSHRPLPPGAFGRERDAMLELPYPPLVSVVWVKYLDPQGVEHQLDPDDYELVQGGIEPGGIRPAPGKSWPATMGGPDTVRVQFVAGYEALPSRIRAAILLIVGDLFQNREAQFVEGRIVVLPNPTVDGLLGRFRQPVVR
jgi:hypothetical protein